MRGVAVFNNAQEGSTMLSDNFMVSEFACNDGSNAVFIDPKLIYVLQNLRDYFGVEISISSGYRTPTYNATIGGATNSCHLYGMAADIKAKNGDVTPQQIYDYLETCMPNTGGLGLASTYVHVDVRSEKSRWTY